MKSEIRIVIADDHPIVRQGLRQAIEADPQLKVVAEAGDGRTALDRTQELTPEVAVLDIDMPLMDGFAVAREVRDQKLSAAVIFLTIHREEDLFNEAMDVGAQGYVLKDSTTTDIVALPQMSFGPFTGPNAGAGTLAPGSYNAVQVPASGTLNFSAGEYRINQLTLGNNAELKLDLTAGPITIFVTSQLQLGNGSKMTLTGGSSLDVTINYAGTQTASFGTTSNYQGTLVAPLALVNLQSSSSYTGSVCAQRITFGGSASARFHGN